MDFGSVAAGVVAYGLSVVASVLLVFGTYRLNTVLTRRIDEERLLREGHRSVAISLGAVVLSQAVLLRHAIFPSMVVLRDLFVTRPGLSAALVAVAQCLAFFAVVACAVPSPGSDMPTAWVRQAMVLAVPIPVQAPAQG